MDRAELSSVPRGSVGLLSRRSDLLPAQIGGSEPRRRSSSWPTPTLSSCSGSTPSWVLSWTSCGRPGPRRRRAGSDTTIPVTTAMRPASAPRDGSGPSRRRPGSTCVAAVHRGVRRASERRPAPATGAPRPKLCTASTSGGAAAGAVYLNAGPLFHVGTLKTTLATFLAGGTNVFTPRVDVEELCRLIASERCTGAFLQPPTIDAMVELKRRRPLRPVIAARQTGIRRVERDDQPRRARSVP